MNILHVNLWLWRCLKSLRGCKLSAVQNDKPQREIVLFVRDVFLLLNWNDSFYNISNNSSDLQPRRVFWQVSVCMMQDVFTRAYTRACIHAHTTGILWNKIYCKSCTSELILRPTNGLSFCSVEDASPAHLSLDKLSLQRFQHSCPGTSAWPGVMLLPLAMFQLPHCSGQCHTLVGLHCVACSANQWLRAETGALGGQICAEQRKGALSFGRHCIQLCGPTSVGWELQPSLEEHCWGLCDCYVSSHFCPIDNALS